MHHTDISADRTVKGNILSLNVLLFNLCLDNVPSDIRAHVHVKAVSFFNGILQNMPIMMNSVTYWAQSTILMRKTFNI